MPQFSNIFRSSFLGSSASNAVNGPAFATSNATETENEQKKPDETLEDSVQVETAKDNAKPPEVPAINTNTTRPTAPKARKRQSLLAFFSKKSTGSSIAPSASTDTDNVEQFATPDSNETHEGNAVVTEASATDTPKPSTDSTAISPKSEQQDPTQIHSATTESSENSKQAGCSSSCIHASQSPSTSDKPSREQHTNTYRQLQSSVLELVSQELSKHNITLPKHTHLEKLWRKCETGHKDKPNTSKVWWDRILFTRSKKPVQEIKAEEHHLATVFDTPLAEVVKVASPPLEKTSSDTIPTIACECINYLSEHLSTTGIFRVSGSERRIHALEKVFNSPPLYGFNVSNEWFQRDKNLASQCSPDGTSPKRAPRPVSGTSSDRPSCDGDSEHEDHEYKGMVFDIADLLKKWVRSIPGGLIPLEVFNILLRCMDVPECNRGPFLSLALLLLPKSHYATLESMLLLLSATSIHFKHNAMTATNLARIFAPVFVRVKTVSKDPKETALAYEKAALVVEYLVKGIHEGSIVVCALSDAAKTVQKAAEVAIAKEESGSTSSFAVTSYTPWTLFEKLKQDVVANVRGGTVRKPSLSTFVPLGNVLRSEQQEEDNEKQESSEEVAAQEQKTSEVNASDALDINKDENVLASEYFDAPDTLQSNSSISVKDKKTPPKAVIVTTQDKTKSDAKKQKDVKIKRSNTSPLLPSSRHRQRGMPSSPLRSKTRAGQIDRKVQEVEPSQSPNETQHRPPASVDVIKGLLQDMPAMKELSRGKSESNIGVDRQKRGLSLFRKSPSRGVEVNSEKRAQGSGSDSQGQVDQNDKAPNSDNKPSTEIDQKISVEENEPRRPFSVDLARLRDDMNSVYRRLETLIRSSSSS